MEQDKRGDGTDTGRSVSGGEAAFVGIGGIGSGSHVSEPRIFVAKDFRVGVLLGGVQLFVKTGVSMDTITQTSFCSIQEVSGVSAWYLLLTFGGLDGTIQIRTPLTNTSITTLEFRKFYSGTWTDWVNIL